jgi:hypothetical protein
VECFLKKEVNIMGYNSNIRGMIEGFSEDSYLLIKEDLECVFNDVDWYSERIIEKKGELGEIKKTIINKGGSLEIHSYGKHYDEWIHPVYDKIAFCIDDGGCGCLDYEGEDVGDICCIFFTTRQWKEVWAEIQYPLNPFISGG